MGQKAHPTGLRLGIVEHWRSRWYADKKNFGRFLVEDHSVRSGHFHRDSLLANVVILSYHISQNRRKIHQKHTPDTKVH